jgi:hypothetical protein
MSIYWQKEAARILHVDMCGSMSVEQNTTIIREATKIVEAAKEPLPDFRRYRPRSAIHRHNHRL